MTTAITARATQFADIITGFAEIASTCAELNRRHDAELAPHRARLEDLRRQLMDELFADAEDDEREAAVDLSGYIAALDAAEGLT